MPEIGSAARGQEVVEGPALQKARRLLREFNVGEPTQTELAKALEPRFEADDGEPIVRKICERTREDWQRGWARNPVGLMVTRIRRYVAGEQLSFLSELGQPAKPARSRANTKARRGGTFRRPQVSYTDEQRAAAEERARQRIEERRKEKAATEATG